MNDSQSLIDPHTCIKCGKQYGKTNRTYKGAELWFACDCTPTDRAFFINDVFCNALEAESKSALTMEEAITRALDRAIRETKDQ